MRAKRAVVVMWAVFSLVWVAYIHGEEAEPTSKPEISSATLDPQRPQTGDRVTLKINATNGTVRAEVRWLINGEERTLFDAMEFPAKVVLEEKIKAGDKIEALITPFDINDEAGTEKVVRTFVRNAPPLVTIRDQRIDGNVYKATVETSDLEGKPVSLTLKSGPKGMKLDRKGRLTWKFRPGTTGKFDVKVLARDEDGAEALLSYSFRIRRSTQVR